MNRRGFMRVAILCVGAWSISVPFAATYSEKPTWTLKYPRVPVDPKEAEFIMAKYEMETEIMLAFCIPRNIIGALEVMA